MAATDATQRSRRCSSDTTGSGFGCICGQATREYNLPTGSLLIPRYADQELGTTDAAWAAVTLIVSAPRHGRRPYGIGMTLRW